MRIDRVFLALEEKCSTQHSDTKRTLLGFSAQDLADMLNLDRSNVSRDLNFLYKQGKVGKIPGKPALFYANSHGKGEQANAVTMSVSTADAHVRKDTYLSVNESKEKSEKPLLYESFEKNTDSDSCAFAILIGSAGSLATQIRQLQAAVLYPPRGLHTLLLGETGVGKSTIAEIMYRFALENHRLEEEAPFVAFNCADYASNPQLLLGHLFGVAKGAYTGAERDRPGLIEKADGGVLFLDEVHRLPPEGQEMLFYLIDRGLFRRLGDEQHRQAGVLIIAATTENPASFLLSTFIRRIPMIIHIPSLVERPFQERLELVRIFFRAEAQRIGVPIRVKADVLRAFCSYECKGNIGQLRSDVQLSCAGAFLNFIRQRTKELTISLNIAPEHVKKSILKIKPSRAELDYFLENGDHDLVISRDENSMFFDKSRSMSDNFYELIEERYYNLRREGLSEEEIYKAIKIDTDLHFRRFLGGFSHGSKERLEQLEKIVNKDVFAVVEEALVLAENKLKRVLPTSIFYGLATHVAAMLERIKQGKEIRNPHIFQIKVEFPAEFSVAGDMARLMEEKLQISFPYDEVGFITLFLTTIEHEQELSPKVGVLVIAHGNSIASNMASVANDIFGIRHVYALDMQLDEQPEELLIRAEELVRQIDQGKGVLLMVDMGFLQIFGEILTSRTATQIVTIEMVSTPMVLEAARKSFFTDADLNEVAKAVTELRPSSGSLELLKNNFGNKIIFTTCLTGAGSALRLRGLLEDCLPELSEKSIQVVPISSTRGVVSDEKQQAALSGREVIAVVGTYDPGIGVPFFSTESVIVGTGLQRLRLLVRGLPEHFFVQQETPVSREVLMEKVEETLRNTMKFINPHLFAVQARKILAELDEFFGVLDSDSLVGFIMHLGAAIERKVKEKLPTPPFPARSDFLLRHNEKLEHIHYACKVIEKTFGVTFGEDDLCYLLQIIIQENLSA